MTRIDLILSAFLFVLFGSLLAMSLAMPWQAGVAPTISTGVGMVLSGTFLFRQIRAGQRAEQPGPSRTPASDIGPLIWFSAAVACVTLLGFKTGGAIFVFGYILLFARFTPLVALIAASAVPAVIFIVFDLLLGSRIFPGLLFNNSIW